jgi:uncharacterized protein
MHYLFITPTLECQSACKYCFTPSIQSPVTEIQILEKAIELFSQLLNPGCQKQNPIITFHGGEPLLAGKEFY